MVVGKAVPRLLPRGVSVWPVAEAVASPFTEGSCSLLISVFVGEGMKLLGVGYSPLFGKTGKILTEVKLS